MPAFNGETAIRSTDSDLGSDQTVIGIELRFSRELTAFGVDSDQVEIPAIISDIPIGQDGLSIAARELVSNVCSQCGNNSVCRCINTPLYTSAHAGTMRMTNGSQSIPEDCPIPEYNLVASSVAGHTNWSLAKKDTI